jgi:hypothetical protein
MSMLRANTKKATKNSRPIPLGGVYEKRRTQIFFYDAFSVGQVLTKEEIKSFLEAYYEKLKDLPLK